MEAKDKAIELINEFKYRNKYPSDNEGAKQCALIHVRGIIKAFKHFDCNVTVYYDFETGEKVWSDEKNPCEFWEKVKQEIEKL